MRDEEAEASLKESIAAAKTAGASSRHSLLATAWTELKKLQDEISGNKLQVGRLFVEVRCVVCWRIFGWESA